MLRWLFINVRPDIAHSTLPIPNELGLDRWKLELVFGIWYLVSGNGKQTNTCA